MHRAKGFGRPNAAKLFMHGLMSHIPLRFLDLLYYLPDPGLAFLKRHVDLSSALSRKLIAERTDGAMRGDALGKDALSLIVKANVQEKGRWRLGDEELVPQFACVVFLRSSVLVLDDFVDRSDFMQGTSCGGTRDDSDDDQLDLVRTSAPRRRSADATRRARGCVRVGSGPAAAAQRRYQGALPSSLLAEPLYTHFDLVRT